MLHYAGGGSAGADLCQAVWQDSLRLPSRLGAIWRGYARTGNTSGLTQWSLGKINWRYVVKLLVARADVCW